MEEFGEVYKLEADSNYTNLFFLDKLKKTEAKTLKKVIELNNNLFLRINRKTAISVSFIKDISESKVILKNNEIHYFSRRRKPILNMKKLALLIIFSAISLISFAQIKEPENKNITVKKVVKVGEKFYIETSQTTTTYQELKTELILGVENDKNEELRDEEEKNRVLNLVKEKKAERLEKNKLLKDALKKGYEPEIRTLEEKEMVDKIKAKINSIK